MSEASAVRPPREKEQTMGHEQRPTEPEPQVPAPEVDAVEDDVEGHGMLPIDATSARHLTSAREADIRRSLYRHGVASEARRPHKRER
jgi:hypothetical protein